jgi:hypothetical protein
MQPIHQIMTTLITSKLIELSSDGGVRFTPNLLGDLSWYLCFFLQLHAMHVHTRGCQMRLQGRVLWREVPVSR